MFHPWHRHGNTNTISVGWTGRETQLGGQGGLTLPDSLTAGRGEAMPWEKAEAAEKGSGAFSQSPIGSDGAEQSTQSIMNSCSEQFFNQLWRLGRNEHTSRDVTEMVWLLVTFKATMWSFYNKHVWVIFRFPIFQNVHRVLKVTSLALYSVHTHADM